MDSEPLVFHVLLAHLSWKLMWIFLITCCTSSVCKLFTFSSSSREEVWLKLALWFWRRRFLNFLNVFSLFCYYMYMYLPLVKDVALQSPLSMDTFCKVWLKLAQWFWRRRFFKLPRCIFTILLLSPLGKWCCPSFEETWIPFTQRLKSAKWFCRRRW